jgi:hypothetical protein
MVGMDYHIPWPPGSPAPAPAPVPYTTSFLLLGLAPTVFSKPIFSHMTDGFAITMEKGTDIGSLIPHIGAPSLTLPVEMLTSASKSHFGASAYQAEGKVMGCALLVSVNPNLNCGIPAPTPTGFVVAITTHIVTMSLADILAGLAAMCADIALQALMNKIGGALGNRLTNAIMRRLRPSTWNNTFFRCLRMFRNCPSLSYDAAYRAAMYRATEAVLSQWRATGRIVGPVVGFFLGGPMGMDAGTFGLPTPGGAVSSGVGGLAEQGGRDLGNMLDPPAATSNYNSGPGAPASVN